MRSNCAVVDSQESEADFIHLFEDLDLNSTKLDKTVESRNKNIKEILVRLDAMDFMIDDVEAVTHPKETKLYY